MQVRGTNISMTRGDSEAIRISVKNSEGTIIPLTEGDTIHFTVRESIYSKDKIIEKVITDFDEGKALITIHPTDTRDLKFISYVYDIQLTRASGSVKTIVIPSSFTITPEITYD